jgi:hypothetical protein
MVEQPSKDKAMRRLILLQILLAPFQKGKMGCGILLCIPMEWQLGQVIVFEQFFPVELF